MLTPFAAEEVAIKPSQRKEKLMVAGVIYVFFILLSISLVIDYLRMNFWPFWIYT